MSETNRDIKQLVLRCGGPKFPDETGYFDTIENIARRHAESERNLRRNDVHPTHTATIHKKRTSDGLFTSCAILSKETLSEKSGSDSHNRHAL